MRRLDWRLVRPDKTTQGASRCVMDELDALAVEAALSDEPEAYAERLDELETRLDELTTSACDAVGAPRVEDDPHWEHRLIDEYDESEEELDLEEYLAARKTEPDCERCPFASPYSIYPMDPCEFSAGALEAILVDRGLWQAAREAMEPRDMMRLADRLDAALAKGAWRPLEVLDAKDYVEKAVYFLRFWAERGFGVKPEDLTEIVGEAEPLDEDDDGESRTIH